MKPQDQAREQAVAAGRRLKEAADRWNATDLAAIEGCTFSLEQSALELHEMLETVRRMPREDAADLVAQVREIQNDAARLNRLTDASAAFLRCAPGVSGSESGFYGADAARYSIPDAEPRGTEA
ncbi:MAG TPA: hypothetical protein VHC72_02955 [Bryobacteraceae bacterium]|nr:hypothetical protein [Bryobacteraceae bacterium]